MIGNYDVPIARDEPDDGHVPTGDGGAVAIEFEAADVGPCAAGRCVDAAAHAEGAHDL